MPGVAQKFSSFWSGARGRRGEEKIALILGAQKAGSSTLFAYLKDHPEINPSKRKEMNFFNYDELYAQGRESYLRNSFVREKGLWPLRKHDNRVFLEGTPAYLFTPGVPERIHRCFANAKFLISLRNPVDRAYSAYNMYKQRITTTGKIEVAKDRIRNFHIKYCNRELRAAFEEWLSYETNFPTFEELVAAELRDPLGAPASLGTLVLRVGLYAEQIEPFFRYFPIEAFKIIEMSALREPQVLLPEIHEFLGLSKNDDWMAEEKIVGQRTYDEPLCADTVSQLQQYYSRPNERLFKLLDRTFDW